MTPCASSFGPYSLSAQVMDNCFQDVRSTCSINAFHVFVHFLQTPNMVPPQINAEERSRCNDEHSEFHLYPRALLNYAAGPAHFPPKTTLPEITSTVAEKNMSCVGFKSFVSDSLFGYICACFSSSPSNNVHSYFYSTRHNFIKELLSSGDKRDCRVERNERLYG